MKLNLIVTCLVMIGWVSSYAQHEHAQHEEQKKEVGAPVFKDPKLGSAYQHYLQLKDALVASKSDEAKKAAGELQKSLSALANGKKASDVATRLSSTSDLSEQRRVFSELSNEITTLVKGGVQQGALYLEYCPMANGNQGAYWLSNEKVIKNPYFGDAMLKCGSVKETIQQ